MRRAVPPLVVTVAVVVAVVVAILLGMLTLGAGTGTRTAKVGPVPVLLVHGFNGSPSGWDALTVALERAGWPSDSIDAMSYDSSEANTTIARQVADEVDALRARTGATRVDVVSHSMGAISTRWYVERLGGSDAVDTWVSLGGVNGGTVWAYGCFLLAPCRDMVPTSSVLEDLDRDFPPSGRTRFAAWWSPCDEIIVPNDNARLPGARNTETACIGHTELRTDPTVLRQVVGLLRRG